MLSLHAQLLVSPNATNNETAQLVGLLALVGLILKPEPDPTLEPKISSPNPVRARHLFLKPDLGPKAKHTERVKICATVGYQKT